MSGVRSGQYNLGFGGIGPNQANPNYMGAGQFPFGEEEEYSPFRATPRFNQAMLGAAPSMSFQEPAGSMNYAQPMPMPMPGAGPAPSPMAGIPAYDGTSSDAYNEATEYGATDPMNPINFSRPEHDKKIEGPRFAKAPKKWKKKAKRALEGYAAAMKATEEPIRHHQFKTMGLLGRM